MDGSRHNVDKVKLGAHSSFFDVYFSQDLTEYYIHASWILKNDFIEFLDCLDKNDFKLDNRKAKTLFVIADFLDAQVVMEKCTNYVLQSVVHHDPGSIEDWIIFANRWLLSDLEMELLKISNLSKQ